jgi:putative colanic acid biosynthesis acetyltransferase WcaF
MGSAKKHRQIAHLDLAKFERPTIPGNRNLCWRVAWYMTNALLFQSAILALLPSSAKAWLLRAFGAQVGVGLVCKPRVTIKYPWFLEIGSHVWLGEGVWIDNHCEVRIGSNVCISQGAYVFTGNHDWNDPRFRFFCKPIEIGDSVWITAFQRVGPGTKIPESHVLTGG